MTKSYKPIFITFEGCEGSGKSTQSKALHKWFLENGFEADLTREPGGTKTAEKIRNLLLDKYTKLEVGSQMLLHCAARIEHYYDLIKPALDGNRIVICDRFLDSTVAYQHYGHGINLDIIYEIHSSLIDNITPDITFVLDIDLEKHKKRIAKRNNSSDRYEALDETFHEKVINGFRSISYTNKNRCHLIDSSKSVETTHKLIVQKIQEYLVK